MFAVAVGNKQQWLNDGLFVNELLRKEIGRHFLNEPGWSAMIADNSIFKKKKNYLYATN